MKKEDSSKTIFIRAFWHKIISDKFYFVSFIITISAFFLLSSNKVREAKGIIEEEAFVAIEESVVTETKTPSTNDNILKNPLQETVSLTEYVGMYSKTVSLENPLNINNICSISEYKIIYQVTKENNIKKIFYNECLGSVELWQQEAEYKNDGSTRYISANNILFKFTNNNLKEIKEDNNITYEKEENLLNLTIGLNLNDINMYFYGENIIFLENNDLILLSDGKIKYKVSDKYINHGGNLQNRVFKAKDQYEFRFIVFENNETKNCYNENEYHLEGPLYTIYSIKYNPETENMSEAQKVVSRLTTNSCQYLEEDLKMGE